MIRLLTTSVLVVLAVQVAVKMLDLQAEQQQPQAEHTQLVAVRVAIMGKAVKHSRQAALLPVVIPTPREVRL